MSRGSGRTLPVFCLRNLERKTMPNESGMEYGGHFDFQPVSKSEAPACSAVSWRVPTASTSFGEMFVTGLNGLTMVLYRGTHGWRTVDGKRSCVCLSHQLYVKDILPILDDPCREICAVDTNAGIWKTIWAMDDSEIGYP